VAIAPTSKSAAAPAALIESAQMSIVELRESDPELVALVRQARDSEVAAGRKGKRAEYRCAACGYGISSFTGDLRAARCVARDAGSMLGGGPLLFESRWLLEQRRTELRLSRGGRRRPRFDEFFRRPSVRQSWGGAASRGRMRSVQGSTGV
jgi:hypothetical protein